jgi:hypothetical protein
MRYYIIGIIIAFVALAVVGWQWGSNYYHTVDYIRYIDKPGHSVEIIREAEDPSYLKSISSSSVDMDSFHSNRLIVTVNSGIVSISTDIFTIRIPLNNLSVIQANR